jgi:inosose dehydratase
MANRRDFLKSGALGMAIAGAPSLITRAAAFQQHETAPVPFGTGIAGYTFLHFSIPESIAMMKRVNVHQVTLKDFHLPLNSTPQEAKQIIGQFNDAGITVYGVGVIYMKTPQSVEQAFQYARNAGVNLVIGVPDMDLLDAAEQKVKETGIRLAIHNHGPEDPLYPGPREVYEKIRKRDPGIGLCLDIGHAMRAGQDPVVAVQSYADRLFDMHIKDVNAVGKGDHAIETGRGIIDFKGLVETLKKVNYRGNCSIEYEKDMTDPLPGLAESVGYFRGVIAGCA